MTAKEAQKMRRLEMENAELRDKIANHMAAYGSALITICEMRAKLALIESALHGDDE
jgi:hypothetical protein